MKGSKRLGVTGMLISLLLIPLNGTGSASASTLGFSPHSTPSSTGASDVRDALRRGSLGVQYYASMVISSVGPNQTPDPSDRVVDVAAWNRDDRGRVHMWDYRTTGDLRNQRWDLFDTYAGSGQYYIMSNVSGKCLDESLDGGSFDGQIVYQFTCDGNGFSDNQIWALITGGAGGYYRFRNLHDNRCLDIRNKVDANDATLQVWSCNTTGWNQSWYLTYG